MTRSVVISIFITILIIYIYYIQFSKYVVDKYFIDDILPLFKTGDMIIFKACNNFNSIVIGSYFGHCGMVYVDENKNVMLFEANGIEGMYLKPHHPKNGIFLSPLRERICKYKGRAFWKRLNHELEQPAIENLKQFMNYARRNFKYEKRIIVNGFKKLLSMKKCDNNTDCGQLTFLSLLQLGLLHPDEYDIPRLNHLKYITTLDELENGYWYYDLVEIIDHPFRT